MREPQCGLEDADSPPSCTHYTQPRALNGEPAPRASATTALLPQQHTESIRKLFQAFKAKNQSPFCPCSFSFLCLGLIPYFCWPPKYRNSKDNPVSSGSAFLGASPICLCPESRSSFALQPCPPTCQPPILRNLADPPSYSSHSTEKF